MRKQRDLPLTAEVNVTNLVDVAFTLLVIFIITAPMLQGGVQLDLPQAQAAPITSSDGVIVSITKDGRIYIGDVPTTSLKDFEAEFPKYARQKHLKTAYVKGDRDVPYGDVLKVIGALKKLDVTEVSLVAQPQMEHR